MDRLSRPITFCLAFALGLLASVVCCAQRPPTYKALPIKTAAGTTFRPAAIGPTGLVVGTVVGTEGQSYAAIWRMGMEAPQQIAGPNSMATGVNSEEQVVGSIMESGPQTRVTPFIWQDGVLNLIQNGPISFLASTISEQGVVIGTAQERGQTGAAQNRAKLYDGQTFRGVSQLAGLETTGVCVTEGGDVIGSMQWVIPTFPGQFLWVHMPFRLTPEGRCQGLGTINGHFAHPTAAAGRYVVGWGARANGFIYAFQHNGQRMRDLVPTAPFAQANGVAEDGLVVGRYGNSPYEPTLAFVAHPRWGVQNLNALAGLKGNVVLANALAIAPNGWIAAEGQEGGLSASYLLVPVNERRP